MSDKQNRVIDQITKGDEVIVLLPFSGGMFEATGLVMEVFPDTNVITVSGEVRTGMRQVGRDSAGNPLTEPIVEPGTHLIELDKALDVIIKGRIVSSKLSIV